MPAKLESCVKDVMKQGHAQSNAWAICRASLHLSEMPCPSCGAVMKDGVCQSCGYKMTKLQEQRFKDVFVEYYSATKNEGKSLAFAEKSTFGKKKPVKPMDPMANAKQAFGKMDDSGGGDDDDDEDSPHPTGTMVKVSDPNHPMKGKVGTVQGYLNSKDKHVVSFPGVGGSTPFDKDQLKAV